MLDRILVFLGKKPGQPCWLLVIVFFAVFLWAGFQPCPDCDSFIGW